MKLEFLGFLLISPLQSQAYLGNRCLEKDRIEPNLVTTSSFILRIVEVEVTLETYLVFESSD